MNAIISSVLKLKLIDAFKELPRGKIMLHPCVTNNQDTATLLELFPIIQAIVMLIR